MCLDNLRCQVIVPCPLGPRPLGPRPLGPRPLGPRPLGPRPLLPPHFTTSTFYHFMISAICNFKLECFCKQIVFTCDIKYANLLTCNNIIIIKYACLLTYICSLLTCDVLSSPGKLVGCKHIPASDQKRRYYMQILMVRGG